MKSVYGYAGLLLLSLGGAWMRWTAEPNKIGENEILVMQGKAENIQQIDYVSEKMEVHLNVRNDATGQYIWVEYIDKKNPEEPQSKNFKAGSNGEKLLDNLSPFVAIRELDNLESKMEEFGLATPSASLTVSRSGTERLFDIGAEAYGTKDYYIRDHKNNAIYLVDDRKFTSLVKGRTTLPDRSLYSQKTKEAISGSISFDGKALSLNHQNHQDPTNAKWVASDVDAETDSTQLETWLGKFNRLSSSRYPSESDDLSSLEERFSLSFTWEDGQSQRLTLFQQDKEWWASSEHTRTTVKLSENAVNALFEDLPSLFE